MLFSAVAEGRILRYDAASGKVSEFRKYTNRTNGLAFAPGGALYGCQEGSRRVVHFAADGSTSTTGFLLEGLYHNQPNNLAIDSRPHLVQRPVERAPRLGPTDLSASATRFGAAPGARSVPQAVEHPAHELRHRGSARGRAVAGRIHAVRRRNRQLTLGPARAARLPGPAGQHAG